MKDESLICGVCQQALEYIGDELRGHTHTDAGDSDAVKAWSTSGIADIDSETNKRFCDLIHRGEKIGS